MVRSLHKKIHMLSMCILLLSSQYATANDEIKNDNNATVKSIAECSNNIKDYIGQFDIQKNDIEHKGYTLTRHVGQNKDQLLSIQLRYKRKAVSSYTNLEMANSAIKAALASNIMKIKEWLFEEKNISLRVEHDMKQKVGYTLMKNTDNLIEDTKVVVVLKKHNNKCFFVLTSYPVA